MSWIFFDRLLSRLDPEEQKNTLSHGMGVLLSFLGSGFLLYSHEQTSFVGVATLWIYSIAVTLLFAASTIYHANSNHPVRKKIWQKVDHISIYILIAGTYSPVTLITLENSSGWGLFYTVWAIALVGAVLKLFFTGKFERLSLLLYVGMGWLIVYDVHNLLILLSNDAIGFLIAGGFFYTVGVVFYQWKTLANHHFIWHLFVLAGAVSHYFMILNIA